MTDKTPHELRQQKVGVIFTKLCKALKDGLEKAEPHNYIVKEARQFCKDFGYYLTPEQQAETKRDAVAVMQHTLGPVPFPSSDTA